MTNLLLVSIQVAPSTRKSIQEALLALAGVALLLIVCLTDRGYNCHIREKTYNSHNRFALVVDGRGRVVLPADARRGMGLGEGDRLILTIEEDGSARLVSARVAAREARGILKDLLSGIAPGTSLADELISDRRAEARAEAKAEGE